VTAVEFTWRLGDAPKPYNLPGSTSKSWSKWLLPQPAAVLP
jgi:hypothetical protein